MNERHGKPDDSEKLSAMIDGELTADELARLTARLQQEPSLAAELERLRAADQRVRRAFGRLSSDPLPANTVGALNKGRQENAPGGVFAAKSLRRRAPVPKTRWPAALAAGIALAVGYLSANLLHTQAPGALPFVAGNGRVVPDSPLHELLQHRPSADPAGLGGAGTAEARFSFRDINGRWCRQAAMTSAQGSTEFVACRTDGNWKIEFAAFAERRPGATGTYAPATGATTAVDGAVDALIRGEALGRDAERQIIERGWSAAGG